MNAIASQITSLVIVYSTVYSDADQSKHQSSASLAFVWGIHRSRWISRTKGQLRGKCFHLMTSSCIHESSLKLAHEPILIVQQQHMRQIMAMIVHECSGMLSFMNIHKNTEKSSRWIRRSSSKNEVKSGGQYSWKFMNMIFMNIHVDFPHKGTLKLNISMPCHHPCVITLL